MKLKENKLLAIMEMIRGFFTTPVGFVRELAGKRRVFLKEKQNIFKLGKQCQECHRPIIHRDSISICQCYSFAHKNCLMNQLGRQPLSQCTKIQCGECKSNVSTVIDFDYNFQVKASWRDFVLLGVCMVVCCLAIIYLTGLKDTQNEQQYAQNKNNIKTGQQIESNPIVQVLTVAVMFASGMLFWLTLMGMLFKRQTIVYDISNTCIDIRVSAFLQLQDKIRQQTLQQIPAKKQLNQA